MCQDKFFIFSVLVYIFALGPNSNINITMWYKDRLFLLVFYYWVALVEASENQGRLE